MKQIHDTSIKFEESTVLRNYLPRIFQMIILMQVEIQNLNKSYANGPEKDLKFHLENGNDCEEQCRRQKCNRKNIISNNISTHERGNGSGE